MLVNERMIESVLYARHKYAYYYLFFNYYCCFRFLIKNGKLYPEGATLYFIPFSDDKLYNEQITKISFWLNNNFFNVDMTSLYQSAYIEKFSQPVIDAYDPLLQYIIIILILIYTVFVIPPFDIQLT